MFLDDRFYYRSFPDDNVGNDVGGDDGGGDGGDDDAETDLGGSTSTGTLIIDSLMHVGKDAGTLSEPGHRAQGAFSSGGSSLEPSTVAGSVVYPTVVVEFESLFLNY